MSQFLATKMISTSSFASSNKGLINSVYALAGPEIKGSSFSVDRSTVPFSLRAIIVSLIA